MSEPEFLGWPTAAWRDMAQVIALAVGGVWAYLLFVRGRARFPRASVTHRISHRLLPGGGLLLRVTVVITNSGVIILRIASGFVRVQQVLPLPEYVQELVRKGEDPVAEGGLDVNWTLLGERAQKWGEGAFEVEPGETDEVTCDFVLDDGFETVQVYSYFANVKKRGRDIGWGLTTLYDLGRNVSEPVERTVESLTGRERGN